VTLCYSYYQYYTEYYQYHEYYTILYIIRYYAYAYICCECGLFITSYSVVNTLRQYLCYTHYGRRGERERERVSKCC